MIPSIGKRKLSQIALGATSIFFGKAIRRNKKDRGKFSKLGIANAAIKSNVSALAEAAILQSETIPELQAELTTIKAHRPALHQMANRNTTTPPDGMINMMVQAFKLAQPNSVMSDRSKIKRVKLSQPNIVISYGSKSKRAEWNKDQKNESTGKRKTRRYTHIRAIFSMALPSMALSHMAL